jgi:uncharacterized protein YutE (UPF0331/DUF86 family)
MIDKEKIKTKIDIIQENIRELKKLKSLKLDELSTSKRDLAAAKYFIRTAIEAMIDIGSHIVAKKLFGVPNTNVEVMLILKEKGVLSKENISTYVKMVKYRNRLTHFYYELTPDEIFDIIQNKLSDFEKYIAEILKYLKKENL